jgi:hypothetical protein
MRRANFGEPATFVRSPIMRKFDSRVRLSGWEPLSRSIGSSGGTWRGSVSLTAAAMAAIWSGVLPQHPPMRLTNPLPAKSAANRAMSAGSRSNPVGASGFGMPALG